MSHEVSPLCCIGIYLHVFVQLASTCQWSGDPVESSPDLGSHEQSAAEDTSLEITEGNSTFMLLDFYNSNEGDNMEDLAGNSGI